MMGFADIKRIEFVVTRACTGHCKHCSLGDLESVGAGSTNTGNASTGNASTGNTSTGNTNTGNTNTSNTNTGSINTGSTGNAGSVRSTKSAGIDAAYAVKTIERITDHYTIESLMTFGGEPLLFGETVCRIHAAAKECGIKERAIITNGFFTRDRQKIESMATDLCASGVEKILLSVDAFHQEFIPVEPVLYFARCLLAEGFSGLRVHPAWLVGEAHDNPYNNETKRLLGLFHEIGVASSEGNVIFPGGNAVKHFSEYFTPPDDVDFSVPCGQMPYTSRLDEITSVSITPNGDMVFCGLSVGNIYTDDPPDIINRYDPYAIPETRALMENGASGLLAYAQQRGIAVDTGDCYTPCMACKKIRAALKTRS